MSWLREPLLHFVVLGALLFVAHRHLVPPPDSETIEIGPDLVASLRADHHRRTGATPNPEEEHALIERHLDAEALYRAALELGLERGDIIVRRRLIQKMEFILENALPPSEPSDADLQAYLETHAERYTVPERLTLSHVFVSNERAGSDARAQAERLRQEITDGAPADSLGDPFLHGRRLVSRSPQELSALFGPSWTRAVQQLDPGVWSQPIASSYGMHLVRVEDRAAGSVPSLAQVRSRVREDWELQQREAARRSGVARLRAKYGVGKMQTEAQKP